MPAVPHGTPPQRARRPRRALLKQELVELCDGDHLKALILERLLYKTRMAEDYAEMQEAAGKTSNDLDEASRGWITASAASLTKEIMLGSSQKTVRRRLIDLVDAGYLIENPSAEKWRGSSSYKVCIEFVQARLFKIGYVLDGYGLPTPETNMKDDLPSRDPDKEWDSIPSASDKFIAQPKLPGIEEMPVWAASQRLLKNAPQHILLTSYLLWKHGGFTPHGSKKNWYSACSGLWEASGCNEHTLNTAIENGQSARALRGLTMSGPRSFITFALDAKSRHTLQERGVAASGEGKKDASQGRLNGQNVSTNAEGKQTIEIGRSNGRR